MTETITIAILAKDKAHCLPLYLKCILAQTFPKNRTYLYIRTNNNTDATKEVLKDWIDKHGHLYKEVYFDDCNINVSLEQYAPHEWNSLRFAVLSKIREESVNWANKKNSHYFVADCDNFIHPQTIEALLETRLPVVGPFLVTGETMYSNFHHKTDNNGYLLNSPEYYFIHGQTISGLIMVDVIHCTYLIRHEVLDKVSYHQDGDPRHEGIDLRSMPMSKIRDPRHEYVIFSEILRKAGINQYLDNRHIYGRITFTDNLQNFQKEPWLEEFNNNS